MPADFEISQNPAAYGEFGKAPAILAACADTGLFCSRSNGISCSRVGRMAAEQMGPQNGSFAYRAPLRP